MDPGMQQMLQSPLMQQLLSNPELVRRMLQMNPAVRELMDRDPQMAQLLNNPELLRESMSIVSNPVRGGGGGVSQGLGDRAHVCWLARSKHCTNPDNTQ